MGVSTRCSHADEFLMGAALIVPARVLQAQRVHAVGRLYRRGDSRRTWRSGLLVWHQLGRRGGAIGGGDVAPGGWVRGRVRERGGGDGGVPGDVRVFGPRSTRGKRRRRKRFEGVDGGAVGSRGVGSAGGVRSPPGANRSQRDADPVPVENSEGPLRPRQSRSEAPAGSAPCSRCALSAGFWCAYEQQGNTTALFADQWVDLAGAPTEFIQSINPVLILALTPAVTRTGSGSGGTGTSRRRSPRWPSARVCARHRTSSWRSPPPRAARTAGSTATKNQMSFAWPSSTRGADDGGAVPVAGGVELHHGGGARRADGCLGGCVVFVLRRQLPQRRTRQLVRGHRARRHRRGAAAVSAALFFASPALTRELDPATVDDDDGYEQI